MTHGQYILYLYQLIFLISVTCLTLYYNNSYKETYTLSSAIPTYSIWYREDYFIVAFALIITFFIGLRTDASGFGDTMNYRLGYHYQEGHKFIFKLNTTNLIWDNFFYWWACMRLGIRNLFVLVSSGYFMISLWTCKRFFPKDYAIAFLVFLAAFSTFSYSVNGIKAGLAAAVYMLGLSYHKQLIYSIPIILVSWGIHHSMSLPVCAFVLVQFVKNPQYFYYGWVMCSIIAFLHISFFQNLFAGMTDESGASYLTGTGDGSDGTRGGFRLDLIIYSAMPVIVGYIAEIRNRLVLSDTYRMLIHIYIVTNSVWMLCMYANFTNRIAYLSWFMYPYVLIYPFLREDFLENQYQTFANVVLVHLGFTLFMFLIY